jgi:hypothetical protein
MELFITQVSPSSSLGPNILINLFWNTLDTSFYSKRSWARTKIGTEIHQNSNN